MVLILHLITTSAKTDLPPPSFQDITFLFIIMIASNSYSDLTLPTEWDSCPESIILEDVETISKNSQEEAHAVFEQWCSDDQRYHANIDMMEVDDQVGADLLGDDMFHDDPTMSPTGPLEEFASIDDGDVDRFSLSLFSDSGDETISLPFKERYNATLIKLSESMKRSQETRRSLSMTTDETAKYQRSKSVSGVLSSIEKSSQQLNVYLKNIRRL